jgi:hypothetical protein
MVLTAIGLSDSPCRELALQEPIRAGEQAKYMSVQEENKNCHNR